jgi:hypothetical protein
MSLNEISNDMMGLNTKTYWLTDRQSQCDFDFGWVSRNDWNQGLQNIYSNLLSIQKWSTKCQD